MKKNLSLLLMAVIVIIAGCKKEVTPSGSTANVVFKFKFDSTQTRLNNTGASSGIAAGHSAQSPVFNKMSAHYLELASNALTALGSGAVLFKAPETSVGGAAAIDFEKSNFAGNNETFLTIPIKNIAPGEYEWLRLSLAYQNYQVNYYIDTVASGVTIKQSFPGTVASFLGFNSYIKTFAVKNQNLTVNANKKQGYWGFETTINVGGLSFPQLVSGEAPAGATTVVNPLFATSPVPAGSCVVTAAFAPGKLKITGTETSDIVVEISLSTNKSFEWIEVVNDGRWEPGKGEQIVDMGVRGMIPKVK